MNAVATVVALPGFRRLERREPDAWCPRTRWIAVAVVTEPEGDVELDGEGATVDAACLDLLCQVPS